MKNHCEDQEWYGEGYICLRLLPPLAIMEAIVTSRFYFVGDEDLLEIIGNSKSVPRLQKHFKKMFAGVAAVILNEDGTKILGISSREGEQVSHLSGSLLCYCLPYV